MQIRHSKWQSITPVQTHTRQGTQLIALSQYSLFKRGWGGNPAPFPSVHPHSSILCFFIKSGRKKGSCSKPPRYKIMGFHIDITALDRHYKEVLVLRPQRSPTFLPQSETAWVSPHFMTLNTWQLCDSPFPPPPACATVINVCSLLSPPILIT